MNKSELAAEHMSHALPTFVNGREGTEFPGFAVMQLTADNDLVMHEPTNVVVARIDYGWKSSFAVVARFGGQRGESLGVLPSYSEAVRVAVEYALSQGVQS